jgi:DNA excision repair protein ERCC-3
MSSSSQSPSRDGQRATTTARAVPIASIEPVAGEPLVYDLSTGVENFLGDGLFCHNSATPVREDEREEQIYTLIGPPIGTDWEALFEAGYVTEPVVEIRLLPWADEMAKNEYGSAAPRDRRRIAAMNPAKGAAIERLLREHGARQALIFVEYIDQGERLAERLSLPFISGETPHSRRRTLFDQFRAGDPEALIVSRVGDEGIDLPNAEVAIAASGLGGSRRQGSQRAGRTMRPIGKAHMYVLATLGTKEEDFARQRTRHLAGRGVEVREAEMRLSGGEETEESGSAE